MFPPGILAAEEGHRWERNFRSLIQSLFRRLTN